MTVSHTLWDEVSKSFGMHAAATFFRGSAGLFALFSVLREKYGAGEVVVPALCCEAVAMAACYAGHEVRFADVAPYSPCVTSETLSPLMSDKTRAVVVIHLFGVEAETEAFAELRRRYPAALFIEDIAHALGGRTRSGALLGGGLDVALMSFADDKMIPGEGGALLFSAAHIDLRDAVMTVIEQGERVARPRLALSLRNLVHAIADCWREGAMRSIPSVFVGMLPAYRTLIAAPGGIENEGLVLEGLDTLDESRSTRYRNYLTYAAGIDARKAKAMQLHVGSTCWRCSVVFPTPDAADVTTRALRKAGIPASNHYFPLNVLFGDTGCPTAEEYARRAVNLWVDGSATPSSVAQTIDIINRT